MEQGLRYYCWSTIPCPTHRVIPAKAGISVREAEAENRDPRFRGDDAVVDGRQGGASRSPPPVTHFAFWIPYAKNCEFRPFTG